MLITEKKELEKYESACRLWQGIPGIEVTKKGRIFITFYSGGICEQIGNFALVLKSDDGVNFSEPVVAAYKDGHRCYDCVLWIDPLERLWFIWSVAPNHGVYASICENPDAEDLVWNEPVYIGRDVMMNKPTVLKSGEWLFPIAVWKNGLRPSESEHNLPDDDRKAFVYKTTDEGKSFEKISGVEIEDRNFDEHMLLEINGGALAMYLRTNYGIGVAYSPDNGKTWTKGEKSGIEGPCSRFFIRRLKSGRILLLNHYNFKGRNNLTALLSEDEGKTWKYSLLLDARNDVSYPDAVEADDGYIYITYDRERGDFKNSISEVYSCAREILMAKITEDDIINGKILSEKSMLCHVVSKLQKYKYEENNLLTELGRICTEEEIDKAKHLFIRSYEGIIEGLYERLCLGEKIESLEGERKEKYNKLLQNIKNNVGRKEINVCKIVRLLND